MISGVVRPFKEAMLFELNTPKVYKVEGVMFVVSSVVKLAKCPLALSVFLSMEKKSSTFCWSVILGSGMQGPGAVRGEYSRKADKHVAQPLMLRELEGHVPQEE